MAYAPIMIGTHGLIGPSACSGACRTASYVNLLVAGMWRLERKLGSGSFGEVYVGTNISTGSEYAIKLETKNMRRPQLAHEYWVYRSLAGGPGIPNVHWFGRIGDLNVMVMDILGPSLQDLFNFCSRKFTMKSVLMLADQLVTRLEYIHRKNFLHRDIKPQNILIGPDKRGQNQVYIIDFGLSKKYRDPETRQHIPSVAHKSFTGTPMFASISTHLGYEQGRKDDLVSLGYMLMYFNRGNLPWERLKGSTKKETTNKILMKKMGTPNELLCKNFPLEFTVYLNFCRSLRFDEEPDYAFLRSLFRNVLCRQGYTADYQFDWNRRRPRAVKRYWQISQIKYEMCQNQRYQIYRRAVTRDCMVIAIPDPPSCLHSIPDFNNAITCG